MISTRPEPKGSGLFLSCLVTAMLVCGSCARRSDSGRSTTSSPSTEDAEKVLGVRQWLVMPNQPVEVDFHLFKGKRVTARFTADTTLQFNTHRHDGETLVLLHSGEGKDGEISFVAPHDGTFSFLWSLPMMAAKDAKMEVRLVGDAVVERWIP